jgi:UDP-N-acetylmuramoylalanine--D-glutamate ligase
MEFVKEVNGVTFINDSKGTNAGAVAKSLESFENLILIMGGTDKGSDFSILKEQVKRKVKTLILIGEAADKIERSLGDAADTCKVADLKHAVELSLSKASGGDTVLLSPGCASFDMFENFEERGREFKRAVYEIAD